ncbi:hypothetical protein G7078_06885 [Sphingomonas sinipercae]|uniref:Lysozyme inhibitor LprI N-terminal domain-containing protein n=1 Tax=Sphingomonas sinipercae TaxID=2714944 RepID=A0A6G7ZNQ8_9SPHN|nr:hypothetical protein [Sphingomonas sinipercae]QIL02540.1 hypothetical protein G7078_06885 [Sphingomonas sinipercae]
MVDIRLSQDPEPPRREPPRVEPEQPKTDRDGVDGGSPGGRQPPSQRTWWILAVVTAVLIGLLLASSVWTRSDADKDKLDTAKVDERMLAPEKQCALQSTYDLIKRELFRRAAATRGSDAAAFAKLSDYALLRVQSPILRGVDEDTQRINCEGTAVLQLPPGVKVSEGGSTLSGDIAYAVQPAADGTGNAIMLGNTDALTVPLATIGRSGAAPAAPLAVPDMDPMSVQPQQPDAPAEPSPPEPSSDSPAVQQPAPVDEPARPVVGSAKPSFNCRFARTRGEVAVCSDSGLAALDRQMASQFNNAMGRADAEQRALLTSTRSGFLAFRDRCRSDACVADTYRGRMREISDIMAGRWNGR